MRGIRLGHFRLEFRSNPATGVEALYKERPPGYAFAGERHSFWELLFVDRGTLRMALAGSEVPVQEGEFLLIPPGLRHGVFPGAGPAPFYITAHFECNLPGLEAAAARPVRAADEHRRLLIGMLRERESDDAAAHSLALCYLAEFLIRASRAVAPPARTPSLSRFYQANAERDVAERAMAYIEAHSGRPLTLEAIASAAGVSASHLEHVFKKRAGAPVMNYLQEVRIRQAKRLLLESSLNVSQIAEKSGYSSVHLFSRRFKKAVSVPPSRYARMVRAGLPISGSRGQKESKDGQRTRPPGKV